MIYWNTKSRLPFVKIAQTAWETDNRIFLSADKTTLYLSYTYQSDNDFCLYGWGCDYNDDYDNGILYAQQERAGKRAIYSALAYALRKRFERVTNGEEL